MSEDKEVEDLKKFIQLRNAQYLYMRDGVKKSSKLLEYLENKRDTYAGIVKVKYILDKLLEETLYAEQQAFGVLEKKKE